MIPARNKFIGGMVARLRGRNAIKGVAKGAKAGAVANIMKLRNPSMIKGAASGAMAGAIKKFR